jgi:hypothetical protein
MAVWPIHLFASITVTLSPNASLLIMDAVQPE